MSQETGHWTQTPEGRKRMAEIAKKAAQAPGARKRMSEIARASHAARKARLQPVARAAKRADIPLATRRLIAKQYASRKENGRELALKYGISSTTVRDWTKQYGNGAGRGIVKPGFVRPGVHWTQTPQGRQRMSQIGSQAGRRRNGLNRSNRARTLSSQACGACRTCLLCQKLGAEPQWIMCLVANPLEPGGVA